MCFQFYYILLEKRERENGATTVRFCKFVLEKVRFYEIGFQIYDKFDTIIRRTEELFPLISKNDWFQVHK